MKIVITGGHLTPTLAVIEKIPKEWEILFVGRKYAMEGEEEVSLEYQTIKSLGIKFVDLNAGRVQRFFSRHTIPSLLRIPKAYLKSLQILKNFKPDVILGFGGYVSVPVAIMGKLLGIPSVIHEQTLRVGMSNKILSSFADKICVSWESSLEYFPGNKRVLTGNPVRKNFSEPTYLPQGSDPLIFIFGGATGSHSINVLIEKIIDRLLEKYRVLHLTGVMDFERMNQKKKDLKFSNKYLVLPALSPFHMGYVLKNASLVISRSGINTVTELINFQKPAVLIPLPFGQKNEQLENARFIERLGLAEVLIQEETNPEILLQTVNKMFENIDEYILKEKNILIENASVRIWTEVKNATDKKNKKTE